MIAPEEDARRRAAHAAGASDPEIGAPAGVGAATIGAWRRAAGLPPNRTAPSRPAPGVLEERRRLVEAGLSDGEIARREGGVSRSAITHWRRQEGLAGGRANPPRRLGPGLAPTLGELRELRAAGLSLRAIAARVGRSPERIRQILSRGEDD